MKMELQNREMKSEIQPFSTAQRPECVLEKKAADRQFSDNKRQ